MTFKHVWIIPHDYIKRDVLTLKELYWLGPYKAKINETNPNTDYSMHIKIWIDRSRLQSATSLCLNVLWLSKKTRCFKQFNELYKARRSWSEQARLGKRWKCTWAHLHSLTHTQQVSILGREHYTHMATVLELLKQVTTF